MRLAIVDLSEHALQPMTNETQDVWVVFNGEIYNHAGLRTELSPAVTSSGRITPTPKCWCTGSRNGAAAASSTACAACSRSPSLDLAQRQLFVARDPFGEKPMYVVNDERGIVFASELKAVLRTGFVGEELSEAGLADYLRFGYVPAPGAILEHIWKLRASEMATFDLDRPAHLPQGDLLAAGGLPAGRRGARAVAGGVRGAAVAERAAAADERRAARRVSLRRARLGHGRAAHGASRGAAADVHDRVPRSSVRRDAARPGGLDALPDRASRRRADLHVAARAGEQRHAHLRRAVRGRVGAADDPAERHRARSR